MKYGKKTMAIICAVACAATSFVFAACGGNDNSDSGNSGYSVSETEWRAAFAEKQFENVTITQKAPGKGSITSNDITINYTRLVTEIMKVDLINGQIMISEYIEYEYDREVDSDKYPAREDDDDRLFIKSGDGAYEYTLEEDGWIYVGDHSEDFFEFTDTILKTLSIYAGMYNVFKYDGKSGNYVYASGDNKISVRLENKKLVSISQALANMPMPASMTFDDYGTTVIDITDDLPPIE